MYPSIMVELSALVLFVHISFLVGDRIVFLSFLTKLVLCSIVVSIRLSPLPPAPSLRKRVVGCWLCCAG